MAIKEQYAIGHWDFRLGTIADQTSNSNNGTFGGTPYWSKYNKGRCLVLDGSTDYIDIGNEGSSIKSIFIRFKPNSITATTDYLIDLNGTDYITIVNGTITVNGFGGASTNIFVNGIDISTIANAIDFHDILIVSDTGFTASDLDIGRLEGTGFTSGLISEVFISTTELTASEASQLYEESQREGHYDRVDIKQYSNPARNILVDGDFEAVGFTDWSTTGTPTKEVGNRFNGTGTQFYRNTSPDGGNPQIGQTIFIIGNLYRFTGWFRGDGGTGNAQVWAGPEVKRSTNSTSWQYFDVTMRPTTTQIRLYLLAGPAGDFADFDDVKVQEVPNIDEVYIVDGRGWNESVANVTTGFLENTTFKVNTGTWKVSDRGTEDGRKILECVGDGQLQMDGLSGVSGWTTNTFELIAGTPTLTKNANNIRIDAVAGDKIGEISITDY